MAGRYRLATPCLTTNGQCWRSTARATRDTSAALSHSTSSATAIATLIPSPFRTVSARMTAIATTLATSARPATSRAPSCQNRRRAGSRARRSVWSGEMRRTARSGSTANSVATHTPVASPTRSAVGTRVIVTSSGRKPPITCGSANCVAMPSTTPAAAPMSPSVAASIT